MGFPIRWRGLYKPITSMSLFNSPELDIALATLCFLARPNRGCTLQGSNGVNYKLQTYEKEQDGEFHLATAFFITWKWTKNLTTGFKIVSNSFFVIWCTTNSNYNIFWLWLHSWSFLYFYYEIKWKTERCWVMKTGLPVNHQFVIFSVCCILQYN